MPAEQPVVEAPASTTKATPIKPEKRVPHRPVDGWVIFRKAFKSEDDVICEANWIERNHFEIRTRNMQRMTIDMTKFPDGAPKKGPWIFHIDGQGVELTGFRPKKGYTGLKRDLNRSQNGKWTVDRSHFYRPGE